MSACEPDTPGGAGDEEPARDDCPGYTSCVGSADCGDCFDECRDVIDCAVTCDCDDFQCFLACYEVDSGSCSSCSEAQDACLQDACGGELDVCHG